MRSYLGIALASFALAAAACGGDDGPGETSGVDGAKKVNTLSSSEVQTFCSWAVAEQGGAGHQTMCGDGVTFTVDTEAKCQMGYAMLSTTCAVTVADAEACVRALAADPCSFGGTACQALIACQTGG